MSDFPGITLAMPEGSKWRGYNHKRNVDIGEVTVLNHRRAGMEVYVASIDKVMTLPYPANGSWMLQQDHVRIAGPDGKLTSTYAPA